MMNFELSEQFMQLARRYSPDTLVFYTVPALLCASTITEEFCSLFGAPGPHGDFVTSIYENCICLIGAGFAFTISRRCVGSPHYFQFFTSDFAHRIEIFIDQQENSAVNQYHFVIEKRFDDTTMTGKERTEKFDKWCRDYSHVEDTSLYFLENDDWQYVESCLYKR